MQSWLSRQWPNFYNQWLPADIKDSSLQETQATCDRCIMAKPQNQQQKFYLPHLKCCTFHPFLPNYLLGAILVDPEVQLQTKNTIREKITRREYALPIGMVAPIRYQLDFQKNKTKSFGKNEDWLCPYFDKDNLGCSIWNYRGVVCTTFFCQSSYGQKGQEFWKYLSDYLSYIEMALMEECLVVMDFSPKQVIEQLSFLNRESGSVSEQKSWVISASRFKKLWNLYDDPENFYKKCYSYVKNFDKKQFEELLGPQGQLLLKKVRGSHAVLIKR